MAFQNEQDQSIPEAVEAEISATHDADVWTRVMRRLKAEVGEHVFSSWFARIELDGVNGSTAQLSVPTKFLKSWIDSHYLDRLSVLIAQEIPPTSRVNVVVRSTSRVTHRSNTAQFQQLRSHQLTGVNTSGRVANAPLENDKRPGPMRVGDLAARLTPSPVKRWEADATGLVGSPLDRRLTFDNFLVGRPNQLAHGAGSKIATADARSIRYNPLYIHAAVGLGKTHLLQAIAHAVEAAGKRVIYLTAEKFMYGFVSALKSQTAIAYKEKLRSIDALIIDDIQFLQGKQIQQEFCHTLNALIDSGRQVVTAADRPAAELESVDERVRSRLMGGLSVEMGSLDESLRAKILEARISNAQISQPNFQVPPAVVSYLAHVIQTNGRDLDGAVNRLLAHSTLTGAPLTVEMAEIAISDLIRSREPKRIKIEEIQKLVASHYNVSRSDLLSARRTAAVVRPRQIAMYLAKVLTLRSLPEIGRRFGGRDHTTVLHAVRKIEGLAAKDASLSEVIDLLKRMLSD